MLDLIPDIGQNGAGEVTVHLIGAPCETRNLVLPRQRHQFVPARMEVDPVDAIAEAVVRLELGQVAIRKAGQLLHVLVAGDQPECLAAVRSPGRLALDRCAKDGIAGKGIEAAGRLRLIENLVGAVALEGSFERGGRKSVVHESLQMVVEPCLSGRPCRLGRLDLSVGQRDRRTLAYFASESRLTTSWLRDI